MAPNRITIVLAAIVTLVVLGGACSKDAGVTAGTHPMPLVKPANFPALIYDESSNPITEEGFALGKKIFYDARLSADNSVSCGNCHQQGNAFTHHGHDVSHGVFDRVGTRNSPPIMNLGWSRFFFWDGGVFNLDLQPLAPIENPVEMAEHIGNVLEKMKRDAAYPALFARAFGSSEITANNMLKALSQFMLQCVSADSRYDKYVRNEGGVLTAEELAGRTLFQQKCASCHSSDLFTDNGFHNNGLIPSMVNDSGRYRITLNGSDLYKFKTPSLRNIANTAPYMHDGRFLTLAAVLDHYSNGVQNSPTLDPLLLNGGMPGIPMAATEKQRIIAFLKTLSDDSFIRNPKLSE